MNEKAELLQMLTVRHFDMIVRTTGFAWKLCFRDLLRLMFWSQPFTSFKWNDNETVYVMRHRNSEINCLYLALNKFITTICGGSAPIKRKSIIVNIALLFLNNSAFLFLLTQLSHRCMSKILSISEIHMK